MSIVSRALLALLVSTWLAMGAHAQTFPDKPVKVIMPFPPGTGPDAVMRLVGERLSKLWKQPVIIENRPGGNGFIAMTAAKRAPADGYTLVQVDYGIVSLLPHLFPKTIPYDSVKDFDAVGPMYWAHWFLVVPGDSKFNNLPDFVAEAAARHGQYTYGSSGIGSAMHLQAAMFAEATKTSMTHIPYKETPQVIIDISRSEVGWAFSTGATAGPLYKNKKVKFLAIASPQRHPAFPEVPTLAEAGGPRDFDLRTWVALFAPKGVPKPVIEKISADMARVLAEPDVREQLSTLGLESWPGTPADLSGRLDADLKKYGDVTKRLKLSLD